MRKKPFCYVRAHRRRWGFSQVELACLVGLTSRSAVSRIERAERAPTTATSIAYGIVFGLATPDLFPSVHADIEETVRLAAEKLLLELAGQTDKVSVRKRALLEEVLERISSRNQHPNV